MTNRIQAAWDTYLREVVPLGAPAVQITESKRAFFAGAQALLGVVLELGDDDSPEDEGVEVLEALRLELEAFKDSVVGGRA